MTTTTHLLRRRRFLPLFVTQLFNAFNDNLYKTAMVLFVVYQFYDDETRETAFSALASGLFILPFFLLSALAGQLADMRDKARIIRIVKACEIAIMAVGAVGLIVAWQDLECATGTVLGSGRCAIEPHSFLATSAIPLMLAALFAMGVHSTFFGPIKYAILPQHLKREEVLAGTGLVEAGTYMAILSGTILAGFIAVEVAAVVIMVTAVAGYLVSRQIPDAPPRGVIEPLDFHFVRASIKLIRDTMNDREIYFAILAISFFWTIGAVLFIQFPPLAKNVIMASKEVASLFLVVFSIGVAIGSVSVNALLKGQVSARYAPPAVVAMGLFVVAFYIVCRLWQADQPTGLLSIGEFLAWPMAELLLLCLLGIAVAGGMFVVPLYAFLTTRAPKGKEARVIAANNIVNSGAMVGGSLLAMLLTTLGVGVTEQVLLSAAMCLVSAWLGRRLLAAERAAERAAGAKTETPA